MLDKLRENGAMKAIDMLQVPENTRLLAAQKEQAVTPQVRADLLDAFESLEGQDYKPYIAALHAGYNMLLQPTKYAYNNRRGVIAARNEASLNTKNRTGTIERMHAALLPELLSMREGGIIRDAQILNKKMHEELAIAIPREATPREQDETTDVAIDLVKESNIEEVQSRYQQDIQALMEKVWNTIQKHWSNIADLHTDPKKMLQAALAIHDSVDLLGEQINQAAIITEAGQPSQCISGMVIAHEIEAVTAHFIEQMLYEREDEMKDVIAQFTAKRYQAYKVHKELEPYEKDILERVVELREDFGKRVQLAESRADLMNTIDLAYGQINRDRSVVPSLQELDMGQVSLYSIQPDMCLNYEVINTKTDAVHIELKYKGENDGPADMHVPKFSFCIRPTGSPYWSPKNDDRQPALTPESIHAAKLGRRLETMLRKGIQKIGKEFKNVKNNAKNWGKYFFMETSSGVYVIVNNVHIDAVIGITKGKVVQYEDVADLPTFFAENTKGDMSIIEIKSYNPEQKEEPVIDSSDDADASRKERIKRTIRQQVRADKIKWSDMADLIQTYARKKGISIAWRKQGGGSSHYIFEHSENSNHWLVTPGFYQHNGAIRIKWLIDGLQDLDIFDDFCEVVWGEDVLEE